MAAYIKSTSINGGKEGRKKSQTPLNAARHNLREIQAELRGRPGERIDPRRCRLNRILSGPETAVAVEALMLRLIEEAGAVVRRKDTIQMFEVLISVDEEIKDLPGFFEDARLWMVSHYDCPLVSAVVHYDESTPHMHLLFVPLRNGKLDGHDIMGTPAVLSRMQTDFQKSIGAKHGLESKQRYSASERGSLVELAFNELKRKPHRLNEANVAFSVKKALSRSIQDVCESLGLECKAAPTAIAVESATETSSETNHKEFSGQEENSNRYHCVAVGSEPASLPKASPFIRTKENEQNPACWDGDRGEFREPPNTNLGAAKKLAQSEIERAMPQSWKRKPTLAAIGNGELA